MKDVGAGDRDRRVLSAPSSHHDVRDSDDPSLQAVTEASKGGRSFEDFYQAEYAHVFKVCWLMCRDRSIAEEATQEAFVRCFERWRRLSDKDWAAGWVVRTAMNFSRRSLKRPSGPSANEVEEVLPDVAASVDLERGLVHLSRRQREAFVLFYLFDLPIAEVAGAMHCRTGTAKTHLFRARNAMKLHLEGDQYG